MPGNLQLIRRLPELFDAIKMQYQLVLRFFELEDAGMVLVSGVKDKGDVENSDGLSRAYKLGLSIVHGQTRTESSGMSLRQKTLLTDNPPFNVEEGSEDEVRRKY